MNKNQIKYWISQKKLKIQITNFKIKIIESLWRIIYSNKEADMYETNLMRRLSGLLYLDNKISRRYKRKNEKKI